MGRTAALAALAAVVLGWSWLRLENGTFTRDLVAWIALVAIGPALLPRRRLRVAAVPVAALLGVLHVFGTLRPGAVRDQVADGLLLYYDVPLPFAAGEQPLMHALVVLAILGFTLAVSIAVAERHAVAAVAFLVAGAVWPATLLTSSNTIGRGAVVLGAALALLAGLSATARVRQTAVAGAVVVAAAVSVGGLPAVAKGAFLAWEKWEPKRPDLRVSVSYVWETDYQPLDWPEKKTTVFTVEAPPISRYWRITTLSNFNGEKWLEETPQLRPEPLVDPLLPRAGRLEENQLEAKVTMAALQDNRLVGASVPVRYDVGDLDGVLYQATGGAVAQNGVPRGAEYTVWSYAARPAPRQLAASRAIYPPVLDQYLVVHSVRETPPAPVFGSSGRTRRMDALFRDNFAARPYRRLYDQALEVAGDAPTPYAAAVAIEAFFRDSANFTYDQAPRIRGEGPLLVEFVTRTRRGYCQHFASAMALMLRYLGIPARVAAGFTSGSYNQEQRRWTVTDHDAHTWVEVWFRGFGWIPFDPTPGRGQLDGTYSTASIGFNPAVVAAALAAGGARGAPAFGLDEGQFERLGRPDRGQSIGDQPGDLGGGVGAAAPQPSLLRLLALVAGALAAAIALLKLTLRRLRFATRDPRRIASACRREVADFLADQRIAVPASATAAELGELLRREAGFDPDRFLRALDAARYGPPREARREARVARQELRRVLRVLRNRLSTWDRTRGLVSLRSLGLTGT